MRILFTIASLFFMTVSATATRAESFLYVSVSAENRIAVYSIDEKSGELKQTQNVELEGTPGALCVDPEKKFLFASIRSTNHLASFSINPKTGQLKPISSVNIDANSTYVFVDPTGRTLLTASYSNGRVSSHAIGKDGSLDRDSGGWLPAEKNAHAIITDRANRFAFVPHTGPNVIYRFGFDAKKGMLSSLDPPTVAAPEGAGPRHLWFHPKLEMLYTSNELGSGITAWSYDAGKGMLKAVQTLSTLPDDFTEKNTCADIELTPDGRFAFVSNRGHDSLAAFAIDEKTGRLTSLGQTPTEETPRSFNITPDARFVYSAGQGNGKMAAYRLDAKTGKLDRFATYEVGKSPAWVMAVTPE